MPLNGFRLTRIAPTPSGFLHIGNAASFLYTAALAERYGSRLQLRIDDMDRQRVRPEFIADVFETLEFLGISCDVGPKDLTDFQQHHSQRLRLPLYESYLDQLAERKLVFACDCSRTSASVAKGGYDGTCRHKNLPLDAPETNWRLDTSASALIRMRTLHGISDCLLPQHMAYFIVRKKDGLPAYQLSCVADDAFFGTDLIVRGSDLYDSTLAQLYLAETLGLETFRNAVFVHHGLITDGEGRKLSKSAGDTSIRSLRKRGWTLADVKKEVAVFQSYP